jgi:hypothetical protein
VCGISSNVKCQGVNGKLFTQQECQQNLKEHKVDMWLIWEGCFSRSFSRTLNGTFSLFPTFYENDLWR